MGKAKTSEQPVTPVKHDAARAPGAPAPPDERDAAIARLERTVAEERQNAATLREGNDALTFKLEILEKGYSKQLADARQRMDAALKEVAGHRARLVELGSGGEDTLRLLSETRAELNRVKADRNLLKEQMSRGGGRGTAARGELAGSDSLDGSQTINALITSAALSPGRERAATGDSNLSARVRADEPTSADMLSPDLIFTKSDKDDDKPR